MIKITDMTLSCLGDACLDGDLLYKLLELLNQAGADYIEMPARIYDELSLKPSPKYILRIASPDEAARYPEINRFVCRLGGMPPGHGTVSEIHVNDVREINFLSRYGPLTNVRIVGLDDVLLYDFAMMFHSIVRYFPGRIELCPEDGLFLACATAVEWITFGQSDLAVSFGGLAGKAPLEEVLMALRIVKRHKPNASYAVFPKIAALLEQLLPIRFPANKTIIGKKVFDVESGIHIDGIIKKPEMYEPFLPELVGRKRRFVIGKHSGKRAVALKLQELGIKPEQVDLSGLLESVRNLSVEKMGGLTDEEVLALAEKHTKGGV